MNLWIPIAAGAAVIAAMWPESKKSQVKPAPVNLSEHAKARHIEQRPIAKEAARQSLGREPSLAEVQYLQAIFVLESSYGRGWKGAMVGSRNYGAVQCRQTGAVGDVIRAYPGSMLRWQRQMPPLAGQLGAACVEYEDTHPDGTRYTVSFRTYDSDQEGANDAARHVYRLRSTEEGLQANGSCTLASLIMRLEVYYGGFCPNATAQHGAAAVRGLRDPFETVAKRDCLKEAVETHAKRACQIVNEVAYALGDPTAIAIGDFESAVKQWRKKR